MAVGVVGGAANDDPGGGVILLLARADGLFHELAAIPFAELPLTGQAEAVAGLARLRSRRESVEAEALSAFDAGGEWALDGHRSAAAALAHRCRLSRAEARRRLRLARRLRATPVVAAALAAGEITTEHASLLVAVRRPEVAPEFERDEPLLVDQARSLSHADLVEGPALLVRPGRPAGR